MHRHNENTELASTSSAQRLENSVPARTSNTGASEQSQTMFRGLETRFHHVLAHFKHRSHQH